jgi:PAS domain S-box-containing protein
LVGRVAPFFGAALISLLAASALAAVAVALASLANGVIPENLMLAVVLVPLLWVVIFAAANAVRRNTKQAAAAELRARTLEAEEERLRMTLESALVGLGLISAEGAWIQVNDRLAIILGRSPDELLKMTLRDVSAPNDQAALDEALSLLGNRDIVRWEAEIQQVRADASRVPVAIALAAIADHPVGENVLLVQETDISARRRLESLRDCLIAVRHVITTATTWEQAAPQVLGSLCSFLDRDIAMHWVVDGDRQAMHMRHWWHRDAAGLDDLHTRSRTVAITAGDGLLGRVWQSGLLAAEEDVTSASDYERADAATAAGLRNALAFPVVNAGVVTGVIELLAGDMRKVEDDLVTMLSTAGVEIGQFIQRAETSRALRRSEADHRAIYERSPIGIARISSDGELLEGNPSLLQMLGYDIDTMRTQAWPDLLRAYDQAASRSRIAPLLAGITDGASVQVRAATSDGTWRWLQLTATSIPDAKDQPQHLLVLIEDVTSVREAQDKLGEALESQRAANANLEKLDRTKTEFLSIVSHEFRTALTGIQGFSELIRDGGLEAEEVRAYGGYIFNDADRVNRLIGDMLDLDRMESGRMTIRTADVDINEILSDAIVRAGSSATTVEFKADLDPRLPIVLGDRDRLIQVVSNLVNNAIKYSPDGGNVTLSSRADSGFALVSVTDTGLGIPPDEISHVFERFRRVRSGAAQSIPGTGLGLTIVKQIVEMHGGKIWVESAVGHGSSFHFTIPLAADPAHVQRRHA